METFIQTFSDLIRARLQELKLNAFSAENAAGLPPDAIRNVLRSEKQSGPTLARAKEICEALGLEIRIAPKHLMATLNEVPISNIDPTQDAPSGFLVIPWMGKGSAPVAFSRAWLDQHQLTPDFLQVVAPDVIAVAASPSTDAVALLDTRLAGRDGPGLWCYRDAGRVTVAHMTFRGAMAAIHPAAPDGATRIVEAASSPALGLIGKVVWLGQILPLKGSVR